MPAMRTSTVLGMSASAVLCLITAAAWAAPAAPSPAKPGGKAVERRLHSDAVEASTFLWNDWNRFQENYHPNYALDDDPRTAWVEGASTPGAGEWIRVRVTPLDGVSQLRLRLRNGYQKSPALFAANARAKEVTVVLLPSGRTKTATLTDTQGWQELIVPQESGPLEAVEVKIGSVYPGTKYADLCLSDLQLHVTSTARQNPVFEKLKFVALQSWKQQRVAAARIFREQADTALPLLPAYALSSTDGQAEGLWDVCEGNPVCELKEMLARAGRDRDLASWSSSLALATKALDERATLTAAKVSPTDRRDLPPLDGLRIPDTYDNLEGGGGWWKEVTLPLYGVVGALRTDSLRVVEAPSKVTFEQAVNAEPRACKTSKGATYTWALRQKGEGVDAGRDLVRVVVAVRCARVEVRDGKVETAVPQLLVYDPAGRLVLVAGSGYVDGFTWDKVEGRDTVVSARGLGGDGTHRRLDRRVVAAAAP
jgi:hypothetical protein